MKHPWGFGIVLDGDNVVTRLKEGSEAATTGQIAVGDRVLAVNGIAVSRDYPVKSVAIDLPDGAAATFSLERGAARAAPVPFANSGEATMLPPMPAASRLDAHRRAAARRRRRRAAAGAAGGRERGRHPGEAARGAEALVRTAEGCAYSNGNECP